MRQAATFHSVLFMLSSHYFNARINKLIVVDISMEQVFAMLLGLQIRVDGERQHFPPFYATSAILAIGVEHPQPHAATRITIKSMMKTRLRRCCGLHFSPFILKMLIILVAL